MRHGFDKPTEASRIVSLARSVTYDTVGNIKTASDGTTSHTYTYGNADWKDLLTAFDGVSITYDAIGNPTSYYNGTSWTMGWDNGRNLVSASGGGKSITYGYSLNGLRTSKTVGGVTHNYLYASGKLLRETYGSNTLDFFYDADGRPYALKYNGTAYYYITNLQGDVIQLVNASDAVVATYDYDPYGKLISSSGTMADINPLRYRGYYYDTDTGFYYLQSRYYDPAICRFINADAYASTGQGMLGNNMFAYCLNNPVSCMDSSGLNAMFAVCQVGTNVGGSINRYLMEIAHRFALVNSKITIRSIEKMGQQYITYDVAISSENFDKWKNDIETLSTVVNYYSYYMYKEINTIKENDGYEYHWTMSQSHIYSETMAHVVVWFTFGLENTREANLNVDEIRPEALGLMLVFGFDGVDEYEWRRVQ